MDKELVKKIFVAGYKSFHDKIITSPWDDEFAIRSFEFWWKKQRIINKNIKENGNLHSKRGL